MLVRVGLNFVKMTRHPEIQAALHLISTYTGVLLWSCAAQHLLCVSTISTIIKVTVTGTDFVNVNACTVFFCDEAQAPIPQSFCLSWMVHMRQVG